MYNFGCVLYVTESNVKLFVCINVAAECCYAVSSIVCMYSIVSVVSLLHLRFFFTTFLREECFILLLFSILNWEVSVDGPRIWHINGSAALSARTHTHTAHIRWLLSIMPRQSVRSSSCVTATKAAARKKIQSHRELKCEIIYWK